MKQIVILASGSGSNAEAIVHYFRSRKTAVVGAIVTNRRNAGVLDRAFRLGIPAYYCNPAALESSQFSKLIKSFQPDLIVLAGYLKKIPDDLVKEFQNRIVNIHPALLPKHGGLGMYGMRVHEAVKESGDRMTGITIHLVNEHYDEGQILFQESVMVEEADTPERIAAKVHNLEHTHYPVQIEKLLHEQRS